MRRNKRIVFQNVVLTLLVALSAFIAVRLALPAPPAAVVVSVPGAAESAMNDVLHDVEFEAVPAEQVVKNLERRCRIHIIVNWDALGTARVARETPITLSSPSVTLSDALCAIFQTDEVGRHVTLNALDDTLTVSTVDTFRDNELTVRVYDVRDLLTDEYWGVKSDAAVAAGVQNERLNGLMIFLFEYAGDDHWDNAPFFGTHPPGQTGALLTAFGGRLFATQTTHGHRRVESVLAWLRSMK
ncbi:MAG: hypothetical protein JWP03_2210 [Phycisphaerales bacterium]|jgi:hypothetical protein|nr:hypothetical protein [Phycisphaerales bacterium]